MIISHQSIVNLDHFRCPGFQHKIDCLISPKYTGKHKSCPTLSRPGNHIGTMLYQKMVNIR